jgi:hypothetical protein
MKTTPSVRRPRWVCRVARLGCAVFTRGPLAAHAASCADCRRYFAQVDDLESALRRDAGRVRAETPIGLESRILQAISAEAAAPRRRVESSNRGPVLALLGGALAAVAVGIFVLRDRTQSETVAPAGPDNPSAEAQVAMGVLKEFSQQVIDDVVSPTRTLVADNGLRQEIGSVYADARSALGFLALNFLPTPRPDASPATARIGVGG